MSTIKLKTIVPDATGVNFLSNANVSIENTSASTSTNDGALTLLGGIGITKNTNAVSLTSGGSFTTSGGIAVARDVWVGGNEYMKSQYATIVLGDWEGSSGNPAINFFSAITTTAAPNSRIQAYGGSGSINSGILEMNAANYIFGSTGVVNVNNTDNPVSRGSGGSLIVSGGARIAKRLFVDGNLYSYGTNAGTADVAQLVLGPAPGATNFDYCSQIRSISQYNNNYGSQLQFFTHGSGSTGGDGELRMSIDLNGVITGANTSSSTANNNGALVLSGGIGISNTTDATSSTNGGTFTTAGGMAIAKKLYVGSDLDVTGNITGDINIGSTGAIDRDINLKAADIVTPEDFGAVGDGVTDDSVAFQLALNTQKAVICRKTSYLVGNLNMFWGTLLDGNGCNFNIVPGSDYVFNVYGWDTVMKNCGFGDPNRNILKTTTIASNALSGATTITLTSVTGMQEHMAISIKLNNRRPHVSFITSIVGNVITIRHAIPANADAGNVVDAYYGMIKVGKIGEDTRYPKFFNLSFINCTSAIYMGPGTRTEKAIYSDINIADTAQACFILKDCGNDCVFSNWIAFCGYGETDNYVGDGAEDTFQLTTAALIKTDITVTVNGVTQTTDVDFTYASDGSTLTFVVPPPLGQAIVISHYKPSDIGMLIDNSSFATPYIGNFSNISILHCWYGVKLYSTGLTMINPVIDGCNIPFYQKTSGTSVPTVIVGAILGFNGDHGIYIDTGVINTAFTGGLWTIGASASPYKYNGLLGQNVYVETGSTIYIDRDTWNFKDSGDNDSSITENGSIIYMRNAARAEDGLVTYPSYSFRQDKDTGFYRVGANDIGIACGGVKIVDISATAVDLSGTDRLRVNVANSVLQIGSYSASNNPAINFYSANTGGLTTVNAKIQAYGGSASNNTGTLEMNAASYVFGSSGTVSINNTTEASSVSSGGSLILQGGAGIAKRLFVGGNLYTHGTTTGTADVAQLVLGPAPGATNFDYCSQIRSVSQYNSNYGSKLEFYTHGTASTGGDGTVNLTIYSSGDMLVSSTTASTDSSTGALILNGGIAIINTTNAVSSSNGGSLTTAGGVAIAKKLFVGGPVSIDSTAGNFMQFPRLTTTERDALTPADGMVIFNSTTSKLQCYASVLWNDLF